MFLIKNNNNQDKFGVFTCVMFAVGSMVGGGIFAMSGIVTQNSGPGAMVSYLLAGVVVLMSALSFAVVASHAKQGGSAYSFLREALSPVWEFIAMWSFFISTITAVAFMLISFGDYVKFIFPTLNAYTVTTGALVFLVALNLRTTNTIGKTEVCLVSFKMCVILMMILTGFYHFSAERLMPFTPHGIRPVLSSAAMLFSSYLGFSVITNMSSVVHRPQKTIPAALILSVLIVMVIYIGVTLAMLMSGTSGQGAVGLADAASLLMGKWGGMLVAVAACASTLSGSNGSFFGINQLIVQMQTEKFLPTASYAAPSFIPSKANVLMSAAIVTLLVCTGDISTVISYCSVAGIWALIIMNIAAFKIGYKSNADGGLKLPGRGGLPLIAMVAALFQLPMLGWQNVSVGTSMVAAGFILFFIKQKRS